MKPKRSPSPLPDPDPLGGHYWLGEDHSVCPVILRSHVREGKWLASTGATGVGVLFEVCGTIRYFNTPEEAMESLKFHKSQEWKRAQ